MDQCGALIKCGLHCVNNAKTTHCWVHTDLTEQDDLKQFNENIQKIQQLWIKAFEKYNAS